MKTILTSLTLIMGLPLSLMAENITVKVDGMVCSFCSQGLTKAFNKQAAVEMVHVDLDKKEVHLQTKSKAELNDQEISRIILDSGFKVRGIERN